MSCVRQLRLQIFEIQFMNHTFCGRPQSSFASDPLLRPHVSTFGRPPPLVQLHAYVYYQNRYFKKALIFSSTLVLLGAKVDFTFACAILKMLFNIPNPYFSS